jgi:hypothetical protein
LVLWRKGSQVPAVILDFCDAAQEDTLRAKASLQRCMRLVDGFAEAQLAAFAGRAEQLGTALGMPHEVKAIFAEAEIRCACGDVARSRVPAL